MLASQLTLEKFYLSSPPPAFRSTAENTHMMAFFDSLVQREIEGQDSDDEHDLDNVSSSSSPSESSPAGDREGGGVDPTGKGYK